MTLIFRYFILCLRATKTGRTPPGRPIRGPLEQVGKYIDSLIKDLVGTLPSYVRDTDDVLNKIKDLTFPVEVLLVGIDIESLYMSIPHEWGISAVYHFLDKLFPTMGAHNKFVIELLVMVLNNYYFHFLGGNYQ